MIRNRDLWERFEAKWQRRVPASLEENLRIFAMLMEYARVLGVWPPADPLEGIDVDIKVAKAVNTYVSESTG